MPRKTTHPGKMLLEEFMRPLSLSARALAKDIGEPQSCISDLVCGRQRMTADVAAKLAGRFDTTAELWLNLQKNYDSENRLPNP
jgi:addiction module HigA family antidote